MHPGEPEPVLSTVTVIVEALQVIDSSPTV